MILIAINKQVIICAGKGSIGIQYPAGLDIVTERPKQFLLGNELYPTIGLNKTSVLQKITKKHLFVDGNKHTVLAATILFLAKNGHQFNFTNDEGLKCILSINKSEDSKEVMISAADW